jgi:hypothetical protein
MKYRGMECAVIQDVDRGTWSWTVNLINETESGLRNTREGGRYLDFYNGRRPHSSLDDMTPDQAYFTQLPLRVAA